MRPGAAWAAAMLFGATLACEPGPASQQPAMCTATPGNQTAGAEPVPATASWQARLAPGKALTATDATIAAGARGQKLTIAGRVLDSRCQPLAGAAVDVWHATADGLYGPGDGSGGMRCCYLTAGVRTNYEGRFELTTVMPGHYGAQPAHMHVGITGPSSGLLQTEIQFGNDPLVQGGDEINIVPVSTDADGALHATFDFVLKTTG